MKKNLLAIAVLAGSLVFAACGDSKKEENKMADQSMTDQKMTDQKMGDQKTPEEEGVMVGGSKMVKSKNIVENAAGSADHTTLVAAVKAAGLDGTLSGAGPFTVFAPTNAAFDKLPKGTVEGLLKPEKKADLTKILTYHVVPGSYMASSLKDGQKLKTVQGEEISVWMKDGKWMVKDAKGNTANITIADVASSNGVTFVIDGVLMPK